VTNGRVAVTDIAAGDDLFVLAPDAELFPVAELPEHVRRKLAGADGDFAITRKRSRVGTKLLDEPAAGLLEEFRKPRAIVDAVLRFSERFTMDPEEVLESSFPLIRRMVLANLLVRADGPWASPVAARYAAGMVIGGFEILEPLRVLEDTEIYRVREPGGDAAIMKVVTSGSGWVRDALAREAEILRLLGGAPAPGLLHEDLADEFPYLVLEQCPGIHADAAAAELRRPWVAESRRELAGMCCRILGAYADLHERGVTHGDVHPGNVLVDRETGLIRLLDFGLARADPGPAVLLSVPRGGISYFFEPEYAQAVLAGQPHPQTTFASEQYALGVLVYRLLTGEHYLDAGLERNEFFEQIAAGRPLPFLHHGLRPWPVMERALERALAKEPRDRFPAVADFRACIAKAPTGGAERSASSKIWQPQLLPLVLRRFAPAEIGRGLEPPTASVNYGAAGIAYFLYRASGLLSRPDLLAAAELWLAYGKSASSEPTAFYSDALSITSRTVGTSALYHSPTGLHCVEALVESAAGNQPAARKATDSFLLAASAQGEIMDLVTGLAGNVLACALLADALGAAGYDTRKLRALGVAKCRDLREIAGRDMPSGGRGSYLGIAHGQAGLLYAVLQCHRASGEPVPDDVRSKVGELAGFGIGRGKTIAWPQTAGGGRENTWGGWCHGTAGYVHLWVLCHRLRMGDSFLELALHAGEHCWASKRPGDIGQLCCGTAGRAYAMLSLYKETGDGLWLRRARKLCDHALSDIGSKYMKRQSLYKGDVGVALLELDLQHPDLAAMPLFEHEGWPPVAPPD